MDYSKRFKRNLNALVVTVPINTVLMTILTIIDNYSLMMIFGWIICPVFGGIYRSLRSEKKDLLWMIPLMAVLDMFVIVPTMLTLFWFMPFLDSALNMGSVAAGAMVAASLLSLGVRILWGRYYTPRNRSSNPVDPE